MVVLANSPMVLALLALTQAVVIKFLKNKKCFPYNANMVHSKFST